GLLVTAKRADNYHNIETIFYPVGMQDVLEFVVSDEFQFTLSGIPIEHDIDDNIVVKAYRLLQAGYDLPPLHIHLHKNIPSGAGLGGGSADAAFMLTSLNEHFKLNISKEKLHNYALQLGSDCPFFIDPVPSEAKGRGELLTPIELNLEGYHLVVVKPPVHVSTALAYRHMLPKEPETPLADLIKLPVEEWQGKITNQFEDFVFDELPEVAEIKAKLYELGASFALMSGSGSAVYGLFKEKVSVEAVFPEKYCVWEQKLGC
ncbi:MAG: 4-(cytidine 5'-diphospho)-2-C-methyl-D-erythritol kinase, partial [Mangrovibacterium sp.]